MIAAPPVIAEPGSANPLEIKNRNCREEEELDSVWYRGFLACSGPVYSTLLPSQPLDLCYIFSLQMHSPDVHQADKPDDP